MSTDYDELRKSQANRPRMLHIIDICEKAGIDIVEDQDAPAGVMVGENDVEESIFGPCEEGTEHEQHEMCSVTYVTRISGRKVRKVCVCQCHHKQS